MHETVAVLGAGAMGELLAAGRQRAGGGAGTPGPGEGTAVTIDGRWGR